MKENNQQFTVSDFTKDTGNEVEYTDAGVRVDRSKDQQKKFVIHMEKVQKNDISAELCYYKGRVTWQVEISSVPTNMETIMSFFVVIDAQTGEIIEETTTV